MWKGFSPYKFFRGSFDCAFRSAPPQVWNLWIGVTIHFLFREFHKLFVVIDVFFLHRYKTKRLLNSHHISHTEFQHKCTLCDKTYRKKASLKMHMESHTGLISKPYICDVCSKGFRKNCDLVVCLKFSATFYSNPIA